jgi:integrase
VLVGKHIKKWRGHFYVYQRLPDGCEVRRFRNVYLGLKSEMDKGEARSMLRDIIARETRNVAPAPIAVTLRWFYENRFLPQKEEQWKVTSRPKTKRFIENYLLKRFGDAMLPELDKFGLQTYLNELAPKFSKSVLTKIRVYLNSILDEAVELEFAWTDSRYSVQPQWSRPTDCSDVACARTPARWTFALRWNDKAQNSLRIDSSITDGIEVETKTEGSNTNVWVPVSIDTDLEWWRSSSKEASPDAFIFPSARGTAINTNNFLFRVLKEAGKKAEILGVTHQMLRRTCSTYMAQLTTVKDVQAHLRHANAKTTLEHYIKSVPESVRVAVESLDHLLKSKPGAVEGGQANWIQLNPTCSRQCS